MGWGMVGPVRPALPGSRLSDLPPTWSQPLKRSGTSFGASEGRLYLPHISGSTAGLNCQLQKYQGRDVFRE